MPTHFITADVRLRSKYKKKKCYTKYIYTYIYVHDHLANIYMPHPTQLYYIITILKFFSLIRFKINFPWYKKHKTFVPNLRYRNIFMMNSPTNFLMIVSN